MILAPGPGGAAFSEATEGDLRSDVLARERVSKRLGLNSRWATVDQVHGRQVHRVSRPGSAGEGDGIWTTELGLPLAIFTADCFGVVLESETAVGVAHAGWRGTDAGIVQALRNAMTAGGHAPTFAAVGPGIGPCCFEVGEDVARKFPGHVGATSWDTTSVDLAGAIQEQLVGLEVWTAASCTFHDTDLFSYRRDGAMQRLAAIGWIN
jgi:YfiH family protein